MKEPKEDTGGVRSDIPRLLLTLTTRLCRNAEDEIWAGEIKEQINNEVKNLMGLVAQNDEREVAPSVCGVNQPPSPSFTNAEVIGKAVDMAREVYTTAPDYKVKWDFRYLDKDEIIQALSSPVGVEPLSAKQTWEAIRCTRSYYEAAVDKFNAQNENNTAGYLTELIEAEFDRQYEETKKHFEENKVEEAVADGYVAWHPDKGIEPLTFVSENAGADAAFYLLIDEDCAGYDFSDASNPDCNETDQMERAKREGWQIRPVRLVFTDEGEK